MLSDIVDKAALRDLLEQLSGDLGNSRVFVEHFVSLWDARFQRLTAAVVDGDRDEAHIVLLSIASSCEMVGATAVATIVSSICAAVVAEDFDEAHSYFDRLAETGRRTIDELGELLENWGPRALQD